MGEAVRTLVRSIRRLRASPGFAVVSSVSLATSVAIVLAVASVAVELLVAPMPYPDADRIVRLGESVARNPANLVTVSYPNALDWRDRAGHVVEKLGLSRPFQTATWVLDGEARTVHVTFADVDHLELFGAPVAAGRGFSRDETDPESAASVALLSGGFARAAFGDPESAVGRRLDLDGRSVEVVGVLDRGFSDVASAFEPTDVWLPLGSPLSGLPQGYASNRSGRYFRVHGRLAAGVDPEVARAELDALGRTLEEEFPETNHRYGIGSISLRDDLVGDVRSPLLALSAGSLFLLFTGLANFGSLLTARLQHRRGELFVRRALGASRTELSRFVQREAGLVVGAALALGVGVAPALLNVARRAEVLTIPSFFSVAPSWRTAVAVAVAVALTAMFLAELALRHSLRTGRGEAAATRERGPGRRTPLGLVTLQIAIATAIGGVALGLAVSSRNLARADSGLAVDERIAVSLALPSTRYPDAAAARRFVAGLTEALEARPAFDAAVWGPGVPGYSGNRTTLVREGETVTSQLDALVVRYHNVSPGAPDLVGIELVRGRALAAGDGPDAVAVALVSESLAEHLWPGESPLGRRVRNFAPPGSPYDGQRNPWVEIVGVVTDAHHSGVRSEILSAPLDVYYPHAQRFRSLHTLTVVAGGSGGSAAGAVREVLRQLDPLLPVAEATPLAWHASLERRIPGFAATLLTLLASVSLALAGIGIYAVQSEAVASRRAEIAVRRAVGADPAAVAWSVLRSVGGLTALAVVVGLLAAAAALRIAGSLLYEVDALAPQLYVGAGVTMTLVALVATGGPLRRALRVHPVEALKAPSGS